ncbi:MAG: 3-methylornithine--L-lysine ligase PylC, partial [Desulfobacula sp.]|nr:3-methylornithine--L-lysine ligase PylC [Desulfobacula sp.]
MWARIKNIALAFDLEAYKITNSKLKSNALFKKMNLPAPESWPDCGFPIVLKPDHESGSQGVEVFNDSKTFNARFSNEQSYNNMVIQQYLKGTSISIEVAGHPGKYHAFYVIDLAMDNIHDCKRVTAPTQISSDQINQFKKMAIAIAGKINLTGIMDVEVILNNSELKLIEIDARFPSQTPMAVYWSTGINMVEILCSLFLNKSIVAFEQKYERFVIVEHVSVSRKGLKVCGEHIMAQQGPLTLQSDFYGASEAITSFAPKKKSWVATLIFAGNSEEEVNARKENCHQRMQIPS